MCRDEVDYHALSFHNSDPDLDSAGVELERARATIQQLEKLFPKMDLVHSNHGVWFTERQNMQACRDTLLSRTTRS